MRRLYPNLLIRLNATVVKWRNDNKEDIQALVDLADKYWLSIKFVELYPNTDPDFIPLEDVKPILEELGFEKYKEDERSSVYGRGKRIVILTKISCGSDWEDNVIPPHQSDIFVSPDWLVSPYPSSKDKLSIYDAIKKQSTEELENILGQATDFEWALVE